MTKTKVGTFTSTGETVQTEAYKNQYAAHKTIGTAETSWTVQWTAPPEKVSGPITFYAAGNEANGDGTAGGDYIYTATAMAYMQCIPSTLEASPKSISIKRKENATVTITVKAENGDTCSGITVTAATQRNKVELENSVDTDASGNAIFTIKA